MLVLVRISSTWRFLVCNISQQLVCGLEQNCLDITLGHDEDLISFGDIVLI